MQISIMHTIYDLNNTMRSFSVSSLLFFPLVCESVCVYWLSCVGLKLTMTSMRPKHAMQTRGCTFFWQIFAPVCICKLYFMGQKGSIHATPRISWEMSPLAPFFVRIWGSTYIAVAFIQNKIAHTKPTPKHTEEWEEKNGSWNGTLCIIEGLS